VCARVFVCMCVCVCDDPRLCAKQGGGAGGKGPVGG